MGGPLGRQRQAAAIGVRESALQQLTANLITVYLSPVCRPDFEGWMEEVGAGLDGKALWC